MDPFNHVHPPFTVFISLSGRKTGGCGEVGEHHHTHLYLVRLPSPQDHLVPVLWDKTPVRTTTEVAQYSGMLTAMLTDALTCMQMLLHTQAC